MPLQVSIRAFDIGGVDLSTNNYALGQQTTFNQARMILSHFILR